MNNPINDIPVQTPQPATSAADAFEHWLQGRINLSVSGLMSRLDALDQLNTVLVERLTNLSERVRATDGEKPDDTLWEKIDERIDERVGEYFEKRDIHDWLDASSLYSLIEDDVESAINDSSVIESTVESWLDNNLDDKVRDAAGNLTFEVSVS
jgi:hypothetical protein